MGFTLSQKKQSLFFKQNQTNNLIITNGYNTRPPDKIVHREIELPGVPREQVIICPHAPMLNIKNHTSESSHIIMLSYIYIYRKRELLVCSRPIYILTSKVLSTTTIGSILYYYYCWLQEYAIGRALIY
jgi:hypothetical protein